MTSKPKYTELIVPGLREPVDPSRFESQFNTCVTSSTFTSLPTQRTPAHDSKRMISPHLDCLSVVAYTFAKHATTEDRLRLVMHAYDKQMIDEYLQEGNDPHKRGGISQNANLTYRHFMAAAIRLDLFESRSFVSRLLEVAESMDEEKRPAAIKVLSKAWTLALGEYLTRTDDEIVSMRYPAELLSKIEGGRLRASRAVQVMHEAGILFEEDDNVANFWRRYALLAARKTPSFLPTLTEYMTNPDIFCKIAWGYGIARRREKITKGQAKDNTVAITTEHVRQLFIQYAKDNSRDTTFAQRVLEESTPEGRTPGGAPIIQFSLLEMIQFADRMMIDLQKRARAQGDNAYLVPKPLLVNEDGTPKQGAKVDSTVVMRAVSRLLHFTRQEGATEEQIWLDELQAWLVGALYYGLPSTPRTPDEILAERRDALRKMRAGHVGALALRYQIPVNDIDEYVQLLKEGTPLSDVIHIVATRTTHKE